MEMHQVQYFLAVARTRNFTRASEECNVSQPSLSRAIKLLEAELGGDLFVRERPAAQLTTLGQYMRPLLAQCYESALSARSLADAIRKQAVGSLTLVLSRSVDIAPLAVPLARLQSQFGRLQLRLLRGQRDDITDALKGGEADFAIASSLGIPIRSAMTETASGSARSRWTSKRPRSASGRSSARVFARIPSSMRATAFFV